MFSLTPSELLTIAIVALVVFGPRRLPELARQAGRAIAYLRRAAADIRQEVEGEFGDVTKPFRDTVTTLKKEGDELKETASSELGDAAAPFREAATELAAEGKELRQTASGELQWVDVPQDQDGGEETNEAADR